MAELVLPKKEDGTPYRVFCIDDSNFILKTLDSLLTSMGCLVIGKAKDAQSAMEAILELKDSLDLITLDINMPFVDGATILPLIRKQAPNLKIIMVSANASMEKVKQCILSGAHSFVVKPFENQDVYDIFYKVINMKSVVPNENKEPEIVKFVSKAMLLPVTATEPNNETLTFGLKAGSKPYRFLIIESNEALISEMKEMIKKFGGSVLGFASNVLDGLSVLAKSKDKIDCVIINNDIPAIDGLTVLPLIKAQSRNTILVYMAKDLNAKLLKTCDEKGANGVIPIPTDPATFFKELTSVIFDIKEKKETSD
jgi:two-component system, chemotaxis family, chemotaxis protein CheY